MASDVLTIPKVCAHFGIAYWQGRRAVDGLRPFVARFGNYRLVPRDRLGEVEAELRRLGYLKRETVSA